ncbi:hypothetical protein [uncultured Fluviicola sp.]|uniref:hypothetical protein n=1 Tax=uncultured Fluviicola sp. TaxID=463303 RepID=UPI0025EFA440|nr:hypothetical protein [uncultured Fluviicola sp.]
MKKHILFLLFLPLFGTSLLAQNSEDTLIRAVFDKYRSDLLNDRGTEAVKEVDSKTIQYYSDILELTISADSSKVETLSIMDKMSVLIMRLKISKEELLTFSGKDLFIYSVDHGMVGKSGIAKNSIGQIIVNDNFASAPLGVKGAPTEVRFEFYKESGSWKINLTSIFPLAELVFEKLIKDSGKSENELLIPIIEAATNKRVSREVWQPLK